MNLCLNFVKRYVLLICIVVISYSVARAQVRQRPLIFPIPQNMELQEGAFRIDSTTIILVPKFASKADMSLAHGLVAWISDQYGVAVGMQRTDNLNNKTHYILMGNFSNPLIREYNSSIESLYSSDPKKPEGYHLIVTPNYIVIGGNDAKGTFYGFQSLRQLIQNEEDQKIQCMKVDDYPAFPFRGLRVYVPGPDHLEFFSRFISNFMALYKYNKLILEMDAVMRLNRHPELNAGWRVMDQNLRDTRRTDVWGPHGEIHDSPNHTCGDGQVLEQYQVKNIVQEAKRNHIEVIPEIPSLSHSYYLLTRHKNLADEPFMQWPDTYCPSNPNTYKLLFDVLDEYIHVMHPKMILIGHDEWWGTEIGICPRCRGKNYQELFAQDVTKIHDFLASKGIKTGMWADYLFENVHGKNPIKWTTKSGYVYYTPGGLPPSIVKKGIPKDVVTFNYTWQSWWQADAAKTPFGNSRFLHKMGFKQAYGNFIANIDHWNEREKVPGLLGGAPSSWAASTEANFGKDLMLYFLGGENDFWNGKQMEPVNMVETVQQLVPVVRDNLRGVEEWLFKDDKVVPVNISKYCNQPLSKNIFGEFLGDFQKEKVSDGKDEFDLSYLTKHDRAIVVGTNNQGKENFPQSVKGIPVNEDVNSLIFLQACAFPGINEKAYFNTYNFDDTSDLLGYYEIVYKDGFIITVPVRYGVNILEWNADSKENIMKWYYGGEDTPNDGYCYEGDVVPCSKDMKKDPITFFAFKWNNPRLGKKIASVNLIGTHDFINYKGKIMKDNAIILLGVSAVKNQVKAN